jgi:hypothetical protein
MSAVSINCDFLDAMMRLPGPIQRKVRQFVSKFMADPKSPGINYERIQQAGDRNLRSVRIDQAYRAIIFKAPSEDAHILLWVDHHDDAYSWACRRKLVVNPRTGALQIIQPTEILQPEEEMAPSAPAIPERGILDGLSGEDLLDCGVPEAALPALQFVRTEADLQKLRGVLPQESFEALSYLACGIPIEEVRDAFKPAQIEGEPVDTEDFERALSHPDALRRFARVNSPKELEEILDAPLEKWRVFLHPSQRSMVEKGFRGPAKVLGGPGTGKTVVAMHRAKHLAETAADGERVLLTTFTSNLAENLESVMKGFVSSKAWDRLDVVHLHRWLSRFLRSIGVQFDVADRQDSESYWNQAIASTGIGDWTPSFLERELHDVVLPNGVSTSAEYLSVSRRGARGALRRTERGRLWPVIQEFLKIMELNGKRDWLMLVRDAREYLDRHPSFRPYAHIVVDEAQDFHPEEWKLLRALAPTGPNDLFIVGDAHQRIYGRKVVLSRCGIETRGRSSTLRLNYRTTHEIRAWATAMFEGRTVDDLDEGSDSLKGYNSLLSGYPPEVRVFASEEEEADFLGQLAAEAAPNGEYGRVCMVARTQTCLQNRIIPGLERAGIPFNILSKGAESVPGSVSLATMHRVKGLEFPIVVLVGAEDGLIPLQVRGIGDGDLAEHHALERALLFVATTRARERLIATAVGTPSSFLPRESPSTSISEH